MSQQITQTTKSGTSNNSQDVTRPKTITRVLSELPKQPYATLEDLERHVARLRSAPNDTAPTCEVTTDLWDYITAPTDQADEHQYRGLRVFIEGTSEKLLKKKSMTTAQITQYEEARSTTFSAEEKIDLLQAKIDNLKNQKK